MNQLIGLVHTLSKHKVKRIDIVGESAYDSLVQRFYKGIHDGKFTSDEAAAKELYNDSPSNVNYKHLKYRLENRLINTLFFIDVSDSNFTSFQKAYYTSNKNLASVSMLLARGHHESAISLAEKTLRFSKKYEFTEITMSLARCCRRYYSFYDCNKVKFKYYSDLVDEKLGLLEAEIMADKYYELIMFSAAANKRGNNEEMIADANEFENKLKEKLSKFDSYRFKLMCYSVFCLKHELRDDYENLIKTCHEAISYFKSKEFVAKSTLFSFYTKMITAYISMRDYDNAEKMSQIRLKIEGLGVRNTYVAHETQLILYFHQQKYQDALNLLIQAKHYKFFKSLQPDLKEILQIYEAYVHYFISLGKIKVTEKEAKQLGKFRLNKFLNNVPIFSKDKRGSNISILILQVLFLLKKGKYDTVIDRTESLQQYCYKYLKRDATFRSNCFIKMLIILIKSNFHKEATIRKTKALLEKLNKNTSQVGRTSSQVEVVPYQDLWENVISNLENKFIRIRKRK